MRTTFCIAGIAALALWTTGCTTSPEAPTGQAPTGQAPTGQPLLGKAAVFSTEATVVAADYATGELTLEVPNKPGDNFFDVYVGQDFGDLSQVRLGDRLRVSYTQAVSVDLFQPGEVDPGIGFAEVVGTAPPHLQPARAVAEGVSVVAVVEGIDRENEIVALEGPKGVEKVLREAAADQPPEPFRPTSFRVQEAFMPVPAISRDPEVMSGALCFAGTRVPVQNLFDYLEGQSSLDEFLDDFPSVSREAAIAVLEAARERLFGNAFAA